MENTMQQCARGTRGVDAQREVEGVLRGIAVNALQGKLIKGQRHLEGHKVDWQNPHTGEEEGRWRVEDHRDLGDLVQTDLLLAVLEEESTYADEWGEVWEVPNLVPDEGHLLEAFATVKDLQAHVERSKLAGSERARRLLSKSAGRVREGQVFAKVRVLRGEGTRRIAQVATLDAALAAGRACPVDGAQGARRLDLLWDLQTIAGITVTVRDLGERRNFWGLCKGLALRAAQRHIYDLGRFDLIDWEEEGEEGEEVLPFLVDDSDVIKEAMGRIDSKTQVRKWRKAIRAFATKAGWTPKRVERVLRVYHGLAAGLAQVDLAQREEVTERTIRNCVRDLRAALVERVDAAA